LALQKARGWKDMDQLAHDERARLRAAFSNVDIWRKQA
jgi:hypothetical protein